MTYYDCIRDIDRVEPNAYEIEDKIRWIRECEGKVYTELFLMQPIGFHVDNMLDLYRQELSIPAPHNKVYRRYLQAMIHYANGEYERYANSMAMFNDAWEDLNIWFGHDYNSADRARNRRVEAGINLLEPVWPDVKSENQSIGDNRIFAVLHIPERWALAGGNFLFRSPEYVGASLKMAAYTQYGTLMQPKTLETGKHYFLPLVIAPEGGADLFIVLGYEEIYAAKEGEEKGAQAMSFFDFLSRFLPKLFFTGRMLVPEEEYNHWGSVQVRPAEITYPEFFEEAMDE